MNILSVRRCLIFCTTMLFLFSCRKDNTTPPADNEAGTYTDSLTLDALLRTFIITVPQGWNNQALPLVFALHGGGGTADGMEKLTGFEAIALKEKFILVYPQGVEKSWNDGRSTTANQMGINDTTFFRLMIERINSKYKVNSKMIFCTGISNGGFMTSTLAWTMSSFFAACASDAATIDSVIVTGTKHPSPLSIMYIHGTSDRIVPIEGGTTSIGEATDGVFLSHNNAVNTWVKINKCNINPVTTTISDNAHDETTITKSEFDNGVNSTLVVSYIIENGGHTWPGGWQYLPVAAVGKTTKNLNASETIWTFFNSHPKK
jgi:polyhydroxybutyrate depolymerase